MQISVTCKVYKVLKCELYIDLHSEYLEGNDFINGWHFKDTLRQENLTISSKVEWHFLRFLLQFFKSTVAIASLSHFPCLSQVKYIKQINKEQCTMEKKIKIKKLSTQT